MVVETLEETYDAWGVSSPPFSTISGCVDRAIQ